MTKAEVLAKLKELGLDVNGATEEVIQKAQAWLEDQKAQLDTETRRKGQSRVDRDLGRCSRRRTCGRLVRPHPARVTQCTRFYR